MFKTGEQKVIQDNDSCHIYYSIFFNFICSKSEFEKSRVQILQEQQRKLIEEKEK